MNKVIPFPVLAALFQLIFLSIIFITFEAILLTNVDKSSKGKGIATIVNTFLPILSNQEPKDPLD